MRQKVSWHSFVRMHRTGDAGHDTKFQKSFLFEKKNEPHGECHGQICRTFSLMVPQMHIHMRTLCALCTVHSTHIFNCRFRMYFTKACIITDKYIPSNKSSFPKIKINVQTNFITRIVCCICSINQFYVSRQMFMHLNYCLKSDFSIEQRKKNEKINLVTILR